ncbi:glycoside hydrolase [Sinomonas sp. JGH33]|uniref:Glycoside hydrolase n=1 Tax=Sinomonas terricola TaxID=3110330 RepID=A0ABU5TBM0_9MICC|nr:glycoside hydrolase [Sinomonas sp. JGH33]MEA5457078.1 glycoside hydrolase [Sinomonas sp. JGH33]
MQRSVRTAGIGLLTSALLASAVVGLRATPVAAAGGGGSIVVDPSVSYQTIQGWGTSLAWWAEGAGGWDPTKRQALDSAIFGLTPGGNGLGLNVVRYAIGAATPGDTCSANMRVGAASPSFDTISVTGSTGGGAGTAPGSDPTSPNYDWTKDPNQMNVLKDARANGANVFAAAAYSAPASMTKNNCSGGSVPDPTTGSGTDNLDTANNQNYADYLAAVVKHFHDNEGIPFSTIAPVNEPAKSGWNNKNCVASPASGTKCQQGMVVSTAAQQGAIVSDLASDLSGLAYTHISAPEELNIAGSMSDYNGYSSAQQAIVAQLNSHDYGDWAPGTESGTPLYLLGQQANKPVWMSEWGANGDVNANVENHPSTAAATAAMTLSQDILKNENEMHPSAWVAWQAADGPFANQTTAQSLMNGGGDVNDLWGLAGIDYSSGSNQAVTFPLRYYAMGNYSEFVRPGYRMIRNSDPSTFTAWDQGSKKLVIVTTNAATTSATNSYDLSRFGLTGATVTAYQTAADLVNGSGGANEKHLATITPATFSTTSGTLSDTVPADSVTTYVVSGAAYTGAGASTEVDDSSTGSGANQWNYTGSGWQSCSGTGCAGSENLYSGTTHWDSTANDAASMSFTGGRVRLFGVTDTNGGRATVSVDGGPATELDFYSAARHGDQLMWESPQLGTGNHTLTVTASGSANPQSSGTMVALDRAEIDPTVTTTVDDATTGAGANQWAYTGSGWVHCSSTSCADPNDMYASTASWDGTAADKATLTFSGTGVALYGITDTNEGIANISVDGATATPVDFYSSSRATNVPVYTSTGLTNGSHTLTVTVTNQKDNQSSGIVPVIDRAVVNSLVPAVPGPITSVDDSVTGTGANQWNYTGATWLACSGTACGDPQNLFGGTTHWDSIANDTAKLSFNATSTSGTTIGLYGVTDTNEGQANVSVDGGTPTLVDFYSASRHGNQLLWHADNLAAGPHTLTVTVLGTKNASSTGYLIAPDRATIGVTPFLKTVTNGTARNNFDGSVGMQFTTGSAGLVVSALGRMHVSGNAKTHNLSLYKTDGTLVAGATVDTAVANVDAQGLQYAALAQPVALAANTTYYLVSSESNGGDQWYDGNTATLTGGSTINPVYVTWDSNGNAIWTPLTSYPGQTYGPVSLLGG